MIKLKSIIDQFIFGSYYTLDPYVVIIKFHFYNPCNSYELSSKGCAPFTASRSSRISIFQAAYRKTKILVVTDRDSNV